MENLLSSSSIYKEIAVASYQNVLYRFSASSVVKQYMSYYEEIINISQYKL
jgi:hypothetical protein